MRLSGSDGTIAAIEEGADLDAGPFAAWMTEVRGAIRGEHGSDVACDACTACCTASQFIHIGPDETAALASIPSALLFPAPGLPPGHVLLGYDEHGRCPMLIDDACSIYADRPRTCRTYDCRIFPAAGLEPDDEDKLLIAERVRRWRFSHPSRSDREQHDAVRAAAVFLAEHPEVFRPGAGPTTTTQLAVLAVELHESFIGTEGSGPDPEAIRVELIRRRGADHR